MKKFIFLFVTMMSLLFSSCTKCSSKADKKEISDSVTITNYLETVKSDYAATAVDSSTVFYESQIVFNKMITDTDSVALSIDRVMNVMQDTTVCTQITHVGDKTYITKTTAFWLEDMPVDLSECISLDSAITLLNKANCPKPNTRLCVLRSPLGPTVSNPLYIFGGIKAGFVAVDAVTGEVKSYK